MLGGTPRVMETQRVVRIVHEILDCFIIFPPSRQVEHFPHSFFFSETLLILFYLYTCSLLSDPLPYDLVYRLLAK